MRERERESNRKRAKLCYIYAGYVKPFVEAVEGVSTFNHVVGEEQKIECPIGGVPGPSVFYWQLLDTGDE